MNNREMTINCGGFLLSLSTPRVMGILNITPDSFYDGGQYTTEKQWLEQTEKMISEGASIIDIGALSTRPGSKEIDEKEELSRILPAVKTIVRHFPKTIISVDTWRATVAQNVIGEGAHIINDISGGLFDAQMFATIAELNVPYIMMHTNGKPDTMQQDPQYKHLILDIIDFFSNQLATLHRLGVHDVILDPGFGFGKTLDHNYQLLANLSSFQLFELPILIGVSRKSMAQKLLNISAKESLNATTILHTIALQNGANLLRVHDVKQAMEAIAIVNKMDQILAI
jgi:dihydropteroate synthase